MRPITRIPDLREHTGTSSGDRAQAIARELARRVNVCRFLFGRPVTGIEFTAGVDKLVSHGLNRAPIGYFVIRDYGANVCTGVGDATSQPAALDRKINLRSPVTCKVDLWFF